MNWYWPNDVCHCGHTRSQLYHFLSFILVPCSVVGLCNSFGNAAATARATDSELYGYLTTWEGTRIIARVTSWHWYHYSDVIMSARAYHITSLTIVFSTVYHWSLWGEFTGDQWIPRTKGQWRRKCFPFDDVIMATCIIGFRYLFHKWFSNMKCGLTHFRKLYGKQLTFLCHHDFWKWNCTRNIDKINQKRKISLLSFIIECKLVQNIAWCLLVDHPS